MEDLLVVSLVPKMIKIDSNFTDDSIKLYKIIVST